MEQLTTQEIEDLMRALQQVDRDHGLRPHEADLLAKLDRMRIEAHDIEWQH